MLSQQLHADVLLCDLQNIVGLDVEQSVEMLLDANGPLFRENVEKWGAANRQPKRSAMLLSPPPYAHTYTHTAPFAIIRHPPSQSPHLELKPCGVHHL